MINILFIFKKYITRNIRNRCYKYITMVKINFHMH